MRIVIMWPVVEMELVMALRVSLVSHSLEPNVVSGGYGTVETVQTGVADGKGVFVKGCFIKVSVVNW